MKKNGKTYIQMTVDSGDMIKSFKGKYGEAIVVEDNKGGSKTLQLRVENNLSNMSLDMHIVVPDGAIPGFPGYDSKHGAILEIDKNSKKEIAIANNKLTTLEGNQNGPEAKEESVIEKKEETKTKPIEFETVEESDSSLEEGKTKVKQEGENGIKEITYEITFTNGKETNREIIKNEIIKNPVNKIILIGTKEPKPDPDPVIEVKEETNTEKIEFETIEEEDSSLEKGKTKVKQKGVDGSKEVTYEVTYTDGKETNRKATGNEKITKQPVDEIILVGTKELEKIEDGIYGINYKVDYNGDDFSQYFEQQATVKIENGKYYLEFKHNSISFINEITIPQGEVKVINEDKEKEMRVVGFNIGSDLSKPVDMGLKMFYGRTHDVKLNFDLDSLKPIEVNVKEETKTEEIEFETLKENDPTMDLGETKVKTKGKNGSKEVTYKVHYIDGKEYYRTVDVEKDKIITSPVNEVILVGTKLNPDNLNDGVYRVNYDVDYNGSDFSQYFEQPALLKVENKKYYLEFQHNSASFINGITIPVGTLDEISEDKEKGTRVIGFNIGKDLTKPVNMGLKMFYGSTHNVKLNFDLDSLKVANLKVDTAIEIEATPFKTIEENDPTMKLGEKKVKTEGKKGKKEVNYEVTYIDGKESYRTVINETVIEDSVNEVVLIGTKEIKEETNTEEIKFETETEESDKLEIGKTKVKTEGKNGEKEITYEVTYVEGEETARKVKNEKIIKDPVNKVILIGTKKVDQLKPDNAYEIYPSIKHEDGISDSTADDFFEDKAILLKKDGKSYIQMTVGSGDMVKSFKGEYGEAIIVKTNKDGSKVLQLRVANDLTDMPLKMHIVVPGLYDSKHAAILVFDKSSKKEIKVGNHKLAALTGNNNGPKGIEENNPNPKPTTKPVLNPKPIITPEPKPEPKPVIDNDKLTPERISKINYTIKQEDGIKDSVANDFFTNKGILLKKDGKTYVQMTITNGDMVKSLKNKYGKAIIVKQNKDGSIVVQLRVENNLSNMLLDMHIVVPEMTGFKGYNTKHTAMLVFDKNSEKIIKNSSHKLAAVAGNNSGPEVDESLSTATTFGTGTNGDNGDNTPGKPEFGEGTDKDGNPIAKNDNKSMNPQTGDVSNILFYTLLLLGSMTLLTMKFRRRTI